MIASEFPEYQHGDYVVSSIDEQDRIVIVVDFTTEDDIPQTGRLVLEWGQYWALRRKIEADLMAGVRRLVESWGPYTEDRYALGELLEYLGLVT